MSYTPHYISSYEDDSGLNTYNEPFLVPEKAFPQLEDAYCWRGRVLRRRGFALLGRLRRNLVAITSPGTISAPGAGVFNFHLPVLVGSTAEVNAQIIPSSLASPITLIIGANTISDSTGTGIFAVFGPGPITNATLNFASGILTISTNAAILATTFTATLSYYPGLPVMGIRTQQTTTANANNTIVFDQRYAYRYNNGSQQFEELIPNVGTWNGSDSDFFWSTNYWKDSSNNPLFWVTNSNMTGVVRDGMWYLGNMGAGLAWNQFQPNIDNVPTNCVYNAECILPYKNRLLLFNTWEGTIVGGIGAAVNFPQRVRWSALGNPLLANSFYTTPGLGGYLDAPTDEQLISAEFVKDSLLVKFENSSWKLVYTGNDVLPFVFQKINTELGCESKFSLVPFDRGVFGVSNYGITSDDSVNVERIDLQIPNMVFGIRNRDDGVVRVQGIRDYFNELVYWTYPNSSDNLTYPNKVLVYNYRNNTYAIFNDSFTCYGEFSYLTTRTWSQLTNFNWAAWQTPWNSPMTQQLFPSVAAGNQQGFVVVVSQQVINSPSLFIFSITNFGGNLIITSPNHNLKNSSVIFISEIIGTPATNLGPQGLNNQFFQVQVIDNNTFNLLWYNPASAAFEPIQNLGLDPASVYSSGGLITKYNSFLIATKRFSPFYEQGSQCRLGYVDFLLDKTSFGQITSQVLIDENTSLSMTDQTANPSLLGSNVVNTRPENLALIPFQAQQTKIWHRQFVQSEAQNFQVVLTMSPLQTADILITSSDVQLHAMTLYLSHNARLTQ